MSSKARSNCSPGGAGSIKSNVNVNMNTAGGNKKQGITSRVATDIWISSGIQSGSNGRNRNVVFTQNQLSGVGVGHSMFKSSTADGSATIAPYIYGEKGTVSTDYLEFPTAQGFESFPYGLSAGTITATVNITSGSISGGAITGTSIISPSYDSSTATTPMTIASNLTTVNCTLAGSQTSGDLNIGTGARSGAINIGTNGVTGASITVGTSFTSTTINGSLNLDLLKLNSSSGATGQYLASQGTSPPIWATLPASGWVGTAETELSMGTYDITTTSGLIRANGGITGTTMTTSGLITANGGITGTTLTTSGLITANGGITGTTLTISGLITANGGITGTTITTSGLITANGGITGTTLTTSGLITANGGITGTTITTSGLITANDGITGTTITTSGLITANGGITGTTITSSGLITSTIDSATPTTTFSFLDSQTNNVEFCTNVSGVINIGKKTSSTSVQCSNIDLTGTNINNASSETGGDINLCNNQTSGILNIGSGARTTAGIINIGTGSTLANPINIGSASSISSLKGTVNVETKITTPKIDAYASDNEMTIGFNLTTGTLAIGGTAQTGDIALAEGQTSGDLWIGTGPRTATSDINIGTGANGAGNIYIGHKGTSTVSTQAVKINTGSAVGATGATTIGSSTSGTTIGGTLSVTGNLTANGGITLPSGDELTITGTISGAGTITTTSSVASPEYNGPSGNATAMTVGGNQTSGQITIGGAQTTGTLNIGTAIRTSTTNGINIGSNTSALNVAPINIGGTNDSATIGALSGTTMSLNGNNIWSNTNTITSFRSGGTINLSNIAGATSPVINIGAEASTNSVITIGRTGSSGGTTINGALTSSGGLTISGVNGITLTTSAYTPASNQLGYTFYVYNNATSPSIVSNTVLNIGSTTIPAGTFIVHFSGGGPTNAQYNIGINTAYAVFDTQYTIGATTITNAFSYNKPALTVIIQNTVPTIWYLNHSTNAGGYQSNRTTWYYTRIA